MECSACGSDFQITRDKPYQRAISTKLCPFCAKLVEDKPKLAKVLGGDGKPQACRNCKHFGAPTEQETNEWYKLCGRGRVAPHGLGLVYADDVCEEFES